MSKFKITGFDKLQKQLKNMERNVQSLEKNTTVPIEELFTSVFMQKYTQFSSFDEFLSSGGFKVDSQEDFEAIPDQDMDAHVARTTNFNDWKTMLETAGTEHIKRQLNF